MRTRWLGFVAIVSFWLAFDQGTKAWARTLPVDPAGCAFSGLAEHRCAGVPQPVIDGVWDWELAANTGAAFSSLRGSRWILSALALAAIAALGVMAWKTAPEQRLKRFALAAIVGGAAGNLIDRVRDGAVTDFVRWRIGDHRWPIFNVADVALVIGVALLLLETVATSRRAGKVAA
ncbi:MAG TPA: signal peptidase II [Kofleriaceae bacterium]|nr:signal peptidase II [Kofleriaceae bacterium]